MAEGTVWLVEAVAVFADEPHGDHAIGMVVDGHLLEGALVADLGHKSLDQVALDGHAELGEGLRVRPRLEEATPDGLEALDRRRAPAASSFAPP